MSTSKDQLQHYLDFLRVRRRGGETWQYQWMTWVWGNDLCREKLDDFFEKKFQITFNSTTPRPVVDMPGFNNQVPYMARMKHVMGGLLHAVASLIARDDARMRVADLCLEDMEIS
eukprot:gene14711-17885_t